jgi:NTE family protein
MPFALPRVVGTVIAMLPCALLIAACGAHPAPVPPERLPTYEPLKGAPPKIALVLGSGGPRGFAHIGVLKVLEEAGIHPDLIVGSSVGAMVGVLYAAGYDARSLQHMAEDLDIARFLELRELVRKPATGAPIQAFVNEKVHHRTLEALRMPVGVAVTRLSDHKLVIFDRGDAGLAVRASAADPDNFAPVRIGDDSYADGDELSPVPIRAARAMGARFVIAVDVSAYAETTPQGVPRKWIDKDARRARQIRAEAPFADVMLHPDIGYYAGYDQKYRKRVMSVAEAYTRKKLPEIRAALAASAGARPR